MSTPEPEPKMPEVDIHGFSQQHDPLAKEMSEALWSRKENILNVSAKIASLTGSSLDESQLSELLLRKSV